MTFIDPFSTTLSKNRPIIVIHSLLIEPITPKMSDARIPFIIGYILPIATLAFAYACQ